MDHSVKQYLSDIGQRGGRRSRRRLTAKQARDMVRIREARRAFRRFGLSCFWSFDPGYKVGLEDVPWIVDQLKRFGDRRAWEVASRLCR